MTKVDSEDVFKLEKALPFNRGKCMKNSRQSSGQKAKHGNEKTSCKALK